MAVLSDVGGIGVPVDCLEKGDVDGDGKITARDGLLILKFWAGLLASFSASGTWDLER